jgi:hypothetical protein
VLGWIRMMLFEALLDFPPITTKNLGNTTDLGAIGGYYGTERVIW